mmetsp:Transcript_45665/g.105999  ORF Transcript_45665/g.105999 Transcript_45665/m.105999 type:complete len:171 (-) Transcript_45665:199-711(-)
MQPPRHLQTFKPRELAIRDLDGLEFTVVVLRGSGGEYDVIYLDDGNIECGVAAEELDHLPDASRAVSEDDAERRWLEGNAMLAYEARDATSTAKDAMTFDMQWDTGCYVVSDGSVIISKSIDQSSGEPDKMYQVSKEADSIAGPRACGTGLQGIRSLRKCSNRAQVAAAA